MKYDVSCGKGRRGCCLIKPDIDGLPDGLFVLVPESSPGRSSDWKIVFIMAPKPTGESGQTPG